MNTIIRATIHYRPPGPDEGEPAHVVTGTDRTFAVYDLGHNAAIYFQNSDDIRKVAADLKALAQHYDDAV